jgi:predicted DNA-binding transcriptional regulator YafY
MTSRRSRWRWDCGRRCWLQCKGWRRLHCALVAIEQVLPARLRHRVEAVHAATVTVPSGQSPVDAGLLTALAMAVHRHEQLRFDYRDRDGADSDRLVDPYRLVQVQRRWYLMARDLARADWRTFRLDRISDACPTGRRFVPVEAPDPAEYVITSVTASPYRYQAVVLLECPAAELASRLPPSVGLVETVGDDRCRLTVGSDSLDQLAVRLAALELPLTVLEPPELVERMRRLADWLGRAGPHAQNA